jgi:uncharacterized membrane protein
MEIILLVALVGLGLAHLSLRGRVDALTRAIEDLGGDPAAAAPPPPLPSARIATRAAPAAPGPALEPPPPPAPPDRQEWLGEDASPEPAPAAPRESLGGLFERYVGGRLLIWVGGLALAVGGVLLVRYAIGTVTPAGRMGSAAAFGLALLGAGEYARSRPAGRTDPRVAQALVGAGILVLYATAYGALVLYSLISMSTASALMVAVTLAALFLSLRHGAPTAVMGLAGGFATPLLVGDPDAGAVPLLAYLGLLDIALFTLAARRGWTWLAASAVLLSFAWTAALLFGPANDALAGGVFIVALGIAASLVRTGPGWQLEFLRPAALGLIQLALLVGRLDLGLPAWGLYGALALASLFLATRRPEYRPIPVLALVLALILLMLSLFDPHWRPLTVVAGIVVIFAGGGTLLALLRRETLLWTSLASAGVAGPAIIAQAVRPELLTRTAWGLTFIALAAVPLFLAWSRRRDAGEAKVDKPLSAAAWAALLLLAFAVGNLLPIRLWGGGWMLLALAAAAAARRLADRGLFGIALLTAGFVALWSIERVPGLWTTLLGSLEGNPALASGLPSAALALQVLLLPGLLTAATWFVIPRYDSIWRPGLLAYAAAFGVGAAYIVFKQAFGLRDGADFVARGFAERTLITQALFAAGWLVCSGWLSIGPVEPRWRRLAGLSFTALAAARLVWFDFLVDNPLVVAQSVGSWPVANLLAPAYLLSAFWLYRARRAAGLPLRSGLWLVLGLAASVGGVLLMVRQGFQGPILSRPGVSPSESYGYSLAALLLSLALLLGGIRIADKALRLAGLVLLAATAVKVFGFDAAALEGLLRILSFFGLGVAAIGIGVLYTKVLDAEAKPAE